MGVVAGWGEISLEIDEDDGFGTPERSPGRNEVSAKMPSTPNGTVRLHRTACKAPAACKAPLPARARRHTSAAPREHTRYSGTLVSLTPYTLKQEGDFVRLDRESAAEVVRLSREAWGADPRLFKCRPTPISLAAPRALGLTCVILDIIFCVSSSHRDAETYSAGWSRGIALLCLTRVECQTILKSTCWFGGARPSTLERAEPRLAKLVSPNGVRQSSPARAGS
jgi:hypothetical protein